MWLKDIETSVGFNVMQEKPGSHLASLLAPISASHFHRQGVEYQIDTLFSSLRYAESWDLICHLLPHNIIITLLMLHNKIQIVFCFLVFFQADVSTVITKHMIIACLALMGTQKAVRCRAQKADQSFVAGIDNIHSYCQQFFVCF